MSANQRTSYINNFARWKLLIGFFEVSTCLACCILILGFCQPASASQREGHYSLGIVGFNYTDTDINEFSVDGVGGADLHRTTTYSGGGGTVTCCAGWRDGTPLPQKVHIEWTIPSCIYTSEPNMYGETFRRTKDISKNIYALLYGPIPKNPENFEVHFFPNDHVEVAITEHVSKPRVSLKERPEPILSQCISEKNK